jgi:ATP-dependent DNA helicase RecG
MIIHRDYRSSSDSIVKIYNNKIEFYNPGHLPDDITVEKLLSGKYKSTPRNKIIAGICKDMQLIEKYGSGIGRVRDQFKEEDLPEPEFENISDGFQVTAYGDAIFYETETLLDEAHVTPHVTPHVEELIKIINGEMSRPEIQAILKLSDRENFRLNYLQPALIQGLVEMTIPNKPKSILQKYRLTQKGKDVKEKLI